jgi:UrcA family protein
MTSIFCAIARSTILAAAMVATAQPALAQSEDQAPRVEIDVQRIDLTAADQVGLARHRINAAARAVCADVVDVDGFSMRKSACILAARAEGNRQLDRLVQQSLAARSSGQAILLAGKAP